MSQFTLFIPPKGHKMILKTELDLNKISNQSIIRSGSPKCFVSSDFYYTNISGNKNWILGGTLFEELTKSPSKGTAWLDRDAITKKLKDHPDCMVPAIVPVDSIVSVTYYSIKGSKYEQSFIRLRSLDLKITFDMPLAKLENISFETYVEETKMASKVKSNITI